MLPMPQQIFIPFSEIWNLPCDAARPSSIRAKIGSVSFSPVDPREKSRPSWRGKRIYPPALHLSGALSVVSDVRRCRSWTRWDGPAQSNADRRVRETVRERTSCLPRSHESAGCRDPAVRRVVRSTACRVGDVSRVEAPLYFFYVVATRDCVARED